MQGGVSFAFFSILVFAKKNIGVKLLSVPKIGQMSLNMTFPECHILL